MSNQLSPIAEGMAAGAITARSATAAAATATAATAAAATAAAAIVDLAGTAAAATAAAARRRPSNSTWNPNNERATLSFLKSCAFHKPFNAANGELAKIWDTIRDEVIECSGVSFGGGYDHSALKWLKNELKEIPNREEARKRMSGNHDAQDDSERMRLLAKIYVDRDDAEHAAADDAEVRRRERERAEEMRARSSEVRDLGLTAHLRDGGFVPVARRGRTTLPAALEDPLEVMFVSAADGSADDPVALQGGEGDDEFHDALPFDGGGGGGGAEGEEEVALGAGGAPLVAPAGARGGHGARRGRGRGRVGRAAGGGRAGGGGGGAAGGAGGEDGDAEPYVRAPSPPRPGGPRPPRPLDPPSFDHLISDRGQVLNMLGRMVNLAEEGTAERRPREREDDVPAPAARREREDDAPAARVAAVARRGADDDVTTATARMDQEPVLDHATQIFLNGAGLGALGARFATAYMNLATLRTMTAADRESALIEMQMPVGARHRIAQALGRLS